jgi:hypothetical protein
MQTTNIKLKTKRNRTHSVLKAKAHKLLQIPCVPTTEVCEYIYGSKTKKSTLNQKKTGQSPLLFEESCRIIEYYGRLSENIDEIINS